MFRWQWDAHCSASPDDDCDDDGGGDGDYGDGGGGDDVQCLDGGGTCFAPPLQPSQEQWGAPAPLAASQGQETQVTLSFLLLRTKKPSQTTDV